jgi:hypothetical protein
MNIRGQAGVNRGPACPVIGGEINTIISTRKDIAAAHDKSIDIQTLWQTGVGRGPACPIIGREKNTLLCGGEDGATAYRYTPDVSLHSGVNRRPTGSVISREKNSSPGSCKNIATACGKSMDIRIRSQAGVGGGPTSPVIGGAKTPLYVPTTILLPFTAKAVMLALSGPPVCTHCAWSVWPDTIRKTILIA